MRATPSSVEGGDGFSSATRALSDIKYEYISIHELDKPALPEYEYWCNVQSNEIDDATSKAKPKEQQNVGFCDASPGQLFNLPTDLSSDQIDASQSVELGDFLSRPVLIQSFTWTENFDFSESFSPWLNYFNNATIKKKLDNYYLLRCNLHLKFVINASPFYYSAIMVTYRPLSDLLTGTALNPAPVATGTGLDQIGLIGRSQRPKVFLYPQSSTGAEMVLPFLYYKNWLDATSAEALENMGTINMNDLQFVLLNANSVTATDVDIQVYAWAEQVSVAGPTVDLAVQSKETKKESKSSNKSKDMEPPSPHEETEYHDDGAVSGPASAVARAADELSSLPIIGPYAMATSMVANSVGSMAKMFGFTNVPVIDDVHDFKNQSFPHMATTQIGVPSEKLTYDPKNELTVDPRVNGVDLGDDMLIKNIATRESWIQTFEWGAADVKDTLICAARVEPGFSIQATTSSVVKTAGTPGWLLGQVFRFWRGDIIIRLKFLCTKYHRGRVRISWDPHGAISTTTDSTTQVYNRIVDITNETDVEFIVPYTQETSYLETDSGVAWTNITDTALANDYGTSNGVLTVRVLNQQTSPVADAPIGVAVFMRCADNIEFADPREVPTNLSPYNVQSEELTYDEDKNTYQVGVKPSSAAEYINQIHMGESIKSIRQILRRQTLSLVQSFAPANADRLFRWTCTHRRLPLYYGYDIDGIHTANDTVGVGTSDFNFVKNNIINWFGQCYIGNKGSVTWNINAYNRGDNFFPNFHVDRESPLASAGYNATADAAIISNDYASWFYKQYILAGNTGMSLTNQHSQPGLNFTVPMYSQNKFMGNNPTYRTEGFATDNSTKDSFRLSATFRAPTTVPTSDSRYFVEMYCAIGTDFSFIFFLNVPTLYICNNPTPA